MPRAFIWDPEKAAKNLCRPGGVPFEDVEWFDWATALVAADVRFYYGEVRLVAIGLIRNRVHVLVFTVERRAVRVISLRKANRKEVRKYGEQQEPSG